LPNILLTNVEKLPEVDVKKAKKEKFSEIFAFQSGTADRADDYRRIVRESFAQQQSVYIITPTIRRTETLLKELSKGIERYVFALNSNVAKKELLKRISSIIEEKHPVLIIGTGGFLSTPRKDVGTIIVENESAKSYKMQSRPYVDYRIFAKLYAFAIGAKLIYADMPLSIESMWKLKQREYEELSSTRARVGTEADQYIVDMRPEKGSRNFFVLSSPLLEKIRDTENKKERTFIFNVRKGIAPTTICEDCGSVVTCALCNASVVLHTSPEGNVFVCHSCGKSRSAKERCSTCNSWKLKPLGIGSERIKDELIKEFGTKRVFVIDGDNTNTYKKALKEVNGFYKTDGAILVGTELSLSFLGKKVKNSAVASIDSLLSLPDPKMYENIFSLILRIRAAAEQTFILQTRQPELPLIQEAVLGNVTKFYEGEILNRRRFEYPPFKTLIKISSYGSVSTITREMDLIEKELEGFAFQIYPAFSRVAKNKYVLSGLLRVPSDKWPNKKLADILRNFPPNVSINVGPESTL
jgi:primosomal protein N' (replication factor Y)